MEKYNDKMAQKMPMSLKTRGPVKADTSKDGRWAACTALGRLTAEKD